MPPLSLPRAPGSQAPLFCPEHGKDPPILQVLWYSVSSASIGVKLNTMACCFVKFFVINLKPARAQDAIPCHNVMGLMMPCR